jgi:putative exporter of polyketide antibiotics
MTMPDIVFVAALGCLAFIVVSEIVVAVLPLVLVIALVPREERRDLAELLAAADSRRRLRLWPALRIAAASRRRRLSRRPLGSPR